MPQFVLGQPTPNHDSGTSYRMDEHHFRDTGQNQRSKRKAARNPQMSKSIRKKSGKLGMHMGPRKRSKKG